MPQLAPEVTFLSDPGHGWLRVPLTDIAILNLETKITPYSYIIGDFAYLEEDCDAPLYDQVRAQQGHSPPTLRPEYTPYFDRSQPHFNAPQFSQTFWARLRARLAEGNPPCPA